MGYGKIVNKIRKEKGMNLREFGKLTEFSFSNLAKIEKEKSSYGKEKLDVSIGTLKQICDKSEYSFRKFLEEADYIKKPDLQDVFPELNEEQVKAINDFIQSLIAK